MTPEPRRRKLLTSVTCHPLGRQPTLHTVLSGPTGHLPAPRTHVPPGTRCRAQPLCAWPPLRLDGWGQHGAGREGEAEPGRLPEPSSSPEERAPHPVMKPWAWQRQPAQGSLGQAGGLGLGPGLPHQPTGHWGREGTRPQAQPASHPVGSHPGREHSVWASPCVLIATPRRGLPTTPFWARRGRSRGSGAKPGLTAPPLQEARGQPMASDPPALKLRVTVARSRYSGARGPGGSWGGPLTSLGLGFLRCKVGLATLPPSSSGGTALQTTLPSPCARCPGPRGPYAAQKTPRARQADPPHSLQPSPKPDSLRSGFGNKVKGSSAGPS